MSRELERVYDAEVLEGEVVEEDQRDLWDYAISEWTTGHYETLKGRLRMARAAAAVRSEYGKGSMKAFADELGAGRSTVYDYARGYKKLLQSYGSHEAVSARLEDAPLTISDVLEATHERPEDIPKQLDKVEVDKPSTRQQRKEREERTRPKNVETVDRGTCPHCGAIFSVSEINLRTEAR